MPDHTLTIRNEASTPLTNLTAQVKPYRLDYAISDKSIRSLAQGQPIKLSFRQNDVQLLLEYDQSSQHFAPEIGYIDLWTGEDYLVVINDSGVLTQNYDY